MKNLRQGNPCARLQNGRRWKQCVSVLVALIFVTSLMPAGPAVFADTSGNLTPDLTNVLNNVSISDSEGNSDNGPYVIGQDYQINLQFKENNQYQLKANGQGELTYQLPSQIQVLQVVADKPIYAAAPNDQKVLGTYSVGLDGSVTVKLKDVAIDGTPTPGTPLYDNYIDTTFNLYIDAQFALDKGSSEVGFSDTVVIPVTITDKSALAALSITKSAAPGVFNPGRNSGAGAFDFDPGANGNYKITYTSVVTATKGTVTGLTFRDDAAGFSWITDKSWLESVQVSINGGTAVPYTLATTAQGTDTPETYYWVSAAKGTYNDPVSDPNAGFYLVFPKDTELSEGQNITITYVVDADAMLLAAGADPYHHTYGYTLNNNAYASGLDGDQKQLYVNARASVYLPGRNYTTKSGVLSADGKTINWTAIAGDGVEPLTGKSIKDALQNDTMSFNSPVTIKLYGKDHTTQIGSDVTLQTPTGLSFTYDIIAAGVYYADITYSVNVKDLTAANYPNNIYVTVNGKDYGYAAGVNNPNVDMKIQKTALLTQVDGYRAIQWTVKWSIPAAYYGHSVYLNDNLQGAASGYTNVPRNMTVTVNAGGTDLGKIDASDPTNGWFVTTNPGDQNNGKDTRWYFYFSPGGADNGAPWGGNYQPKTDQQSLSPFAEGADVTITYVTMLEGPDASTLTDVGHNGNTYGKTGDTLLAAVMDPTLGGYPKDVENIANFWGYITSPKTGYDYVGVTAPIAKTGTAGGDGKYVDYRVTINSLNQFYTANTKSTYDMGDDPVFTDTFDSSTMEYVGNSFYMMAYGGPNYFGPYDSSKQDELITGGSLSNYIKDNGNGTSTITIHLKDLMQITGPTTSYSNYDTAAPWIGPPTGVSAYSGPSYWWSAKNLWASQPQIRVFYRLQLKADAEPGQHDVYNKAAVNSDWTADNTTTVGEQVVTKEMTKDAATGNTVNASIMINPEGLTLAPKNTDGLYEVTDTMSSPLTIFINSIKVQYQDTPGGEWKDAVLNSDYGTAWSYQFSAEDHTVQFMFPDQKPIKISYSAKVAGSVGDTVPNVSNTVTVAAKYSDKATTDFEVTNTGARISGTRLPVTLFKRSAEDKETGLPGAQFALYMDGSYPDLPAAPDGIAATKTIGGKTFYYVADGSTDENGQLVFDNQFLSYSTGAVYAVTELKAPDGYSLPSDSDTLFALQDQDFSTFGSIPVTVISDYLNIYNEKVAQKEGTTTTPTESTLPKAGASQPDNPATTGSGAKTPSAAGASSTTVGPSMPATAQTGDSSNYLLYGALAVAAALAAALTLLPAMRKRRNSQ